MKSKPEYTHEAGEFTCDSDDVQAFVNHLNSLKIYVHPSREAVRNGDVVDMIFEVRTEIEEMLGIEAVASFRSK
jgi:hypothetical protein